MHKGFTLIEILVAATIVAILVSVGAVSYSSTTKNARDGKRKSDIEQIRQALEMYRTDNGYYPNTCNTSFSNTSCLTALSTYIPALPADPQATPYLIQMTNQSGGNFYGYCLAADLESTTGFVNSCSGSSYSYHVKNP